MARLCTSVLCVTTRLDTVSVDVDQGTQLQYALTAGSLAVVTTSIVINEVFKNNIYKLGLR